VLTAWPVRLPLAVCHSHPTAVSSCITSAEIWQVSIAPHAAVLQPEWNPTMVITSSTAQGGGGSFKNRKLQLVLHWRGISKDLIDDVLKIDEMQTRYNTRISHHGSSAISAPWRWRCFHSEARVRRFKGPLVGPRSGSKDGVRELTSEAQTGKMKVINCTNPKV